MIYVFLADGFEETEAIAPIDMLRRAKKTVVTVGVTGKIVTGSHGIPVTADITQDEMQLNDELEMIVLPGGMPGTLNEEASEQVQAAITYCAEHDRYLTAICAAPSILGHRGLLQGKHAVCYPGFESRFDWCNCRYRWCCSGRQVYYSKRGRRCGSVWSGTGGGSLRNGEERRNPAGDY